MFEIHTDDEFDIVLAQRDSIVAALACAEQIAGECLRHLLANGEGHGRYQFWLAIRDMATGENVAWAVIGA